VCERVCVRVCVRVCETVCAPRLQHRRRSQRRIHFIIVMIRWTGLAPWEVGTSVLDGGDDADDFSSRPTLFKNV